jgi:predicted oxidoreductase
MQTANKHINCSNPIAGCMRWGAWGANFTTQDYVTAIELCVANGITSFDHADIYGSYTTEAEFGHALQFATVSRSNMQLITKCGIKMVSPQRPNHHIKSYNTSKQHIIQSVHQSLLNFKTDYLDVLLIHRPSPLMHPQEIAEVITLLKQEGKILHFGVSNFLPQHVNALHKYIAIEYNQLEISIANLKAFTDGSIENCLQHGIEPMAWSPLGGGILADDKLPNFRSIADAATTLSKKYTCSINQILIAFLLAHPAKILPVLGSTKIERLLEAKQATQIVLQQEDWFVLYTAAMGEEVA